MGSEQSLQEKVKEIQNKYKSYEEITNRMKTAGIEAIQTIIAFDFSASNGSLHSTKRENPYMHTIELLQPVLEKFDKDGKIYVYRFGCVESKSECVVPLLNEKAEFTSYNELIEAYTEAAETICQCGPTSFIPIINKAIEQQKQSGLLTLCIILTDGAVQNDRSYFNDASKYPISFVGVGVGKEDFGLIEKMAAQKGKFKNFSFVKFDEIQKLTIKEERPDQIMACAVLNELPEQYSAMKKLKYL
ncbi:Copine_I [Hexamita inflata]|uniref:Copine I n=1 Tax=Hexamita inflata TaxID=28002 RepID=A0AA86PM14_9EUKA|nr:Copine I [Hexamita inflata]